MWCEGVTMAHYTGGIKFIPVSNTCLLIIWTRADVLLHYSKSVLPSLDEV